MVYNKNQYDYLLKQFPSSPTETYCSKAIPRNAKYPRSASLQTCGATHLYIQAYIICVCACVCVCSREVEHSSFMEVYWIRSLITCHQNEGKRSKNWETEKVYLWKKLGSSGAVRILGLRLSEASIQHMSSEITRFSVMHAAYTDLLTE